MAKQYSESAIVVGAGVAGLAAACVLQQAGYKVTLVERGDAPTAPDGNYQPRVSAFSPPSIELLKALDAWPRESGRIQPYEAMYVWADGEFDSIAFSAAEMGAPMLGAIAENELLQSALWRSAEKLGVTILKNAEWHSLQEEPQGVVLQLASGEKLTADWLVGADGAQSSVRQTLAIEQQSWQYQQHAIVCHIDWADSNAAAKSAKLSHQNTAWQRFLETGPLALLPLADGRSSLVWSVEKAKASELSALDDAGFVAALNQAIGGVGGLLAESISRRFSFPLGLAQAKQYVKGRCLLVGDAAHGVHPLAGQGLNLGLMDVRDLQRVIADKPLNTTSLASWQRRRRAKAVEMMLLTDGLYRLFRVGKVVEASTAQLPNSFLKFGFASFSRNLLSAGMALAGGSTLIRQQLARAALESDA